MRTVNFRDGVLLPAADEIEIDTSVEIPRTHSARLVSKINARLKWFIGSWRWPEWCVLEERAFRILWRNDLAFLRDDGMGVPHELFYLRTDPADSAYYRVKTTAPADPPVGTLPTNTTYFEEIELGVGERYLATEVTCRRTIGEMIGVFNSDPRANPDTRLSLPFTPSERGIEVLGAAGLTVWAYFKMAVPQFTSVDYVAARQYQPGESRLYLKAAAAGDGNCFRARTLVPFFREPVLPEYWALIPFPDFAAEAVIKGAAGDAAEDAVAATALWSQAKEAFHREADKRMAQGQTFSYGSLGMGRRYCRGGIGNFWPSGLTMWLQTLYAGVGAATTGTALTNSCHNEFGDIMGPQALTGNTLLSGEPFDLPAAVGLDYIDVSFPTLFGGNMVAGWEVLDGHFEYVGALPEVEVPIPPILRDRTASGFRAVTSMIFGADAADYHYVGRIVGTVA